MAGPRQGQPGRSQCAAVLLAITLTAAALPHSAALIKQAQLGEVDWLRQHVGRVTHSRFAFGGRPRAYVATEAAVIACLNLRDGEIVWRQVLDTGADTLEQLELLEAPTPAVVTLSAGGTVLRAWGAADGALLWERHLSPSSDSGGSGGGGGAPTFSLEQAEAAIAAARKAVEAGGGAEGFDAADNRGLTAQQGTAAGAVSQPKEDLASGAAALTLLPASGGRDAPLLAVFAAGHTSGFDLTEAGPQLAWELELPGWRGATDVRLEADSTGISTVGLLSGGASFGVARIVLQGGGARVGRLLGLSAGQPLVGPLALGGRGASALTASGTQLCSIDVGEGEALSCQPALDAATAATVQPRILPAAGLTRAVLVATTAGVTIFQPVSAGGYRAGPNFPGATAASDVMQSAAGPVLALAGRDGIRMWTKIVKTVGYEVLAEEVVKDAGLLDAEGQPLPVVAAALGTFRRKDDSPGFRVLATLADATTALLQQGRLVWDRPEALASVLRSYFVEPPATAAGAAAASRPPPSLHERFDFQLLSLKDSLMLAKPEEKAALKARRSELSTKHLPTRDANGFRRLLLLLTAPGKLVALHNGGGRPVWSVDLGPPAHGASYAERDVQLLPWRSSHDLQHAPEVLVLLRRGDGSTLATSVDAHTGHVISRDSLPLEVSQVLELPETLKEGKTEQRVYLLISWSMADAPPAVAVLPDTDASRARAAAAVPSLSFWQADKATGVLRGWGLDRQFRAEERWAAGRPAAAPALLAVVARPSGEPLHTAAKVLGDRSLKVKHLNPHALLVASGAMPGQSSPPDDAHLHVEILDAVTGRPLFRQVHQGCHGPVAGVVAEHWAAYFYWNAEERRHQASVVELYEADAGTLDPRQLLFGAANRTLSSHAPPLLEVLRESFFLPVGVKTAAVSTTARGIAPKPLLLGTAADQVYMMDKRFLDPRRPHKIPKAMTPAEQEERLIPYAPLLPLAPQQYATYNRRVARLQGLVTAPAVMESSSHVLAVGLDLFYTRVAPAGTFDGLADDFPFALLVLLTAVMAGGAWVLRRLATRGDVKRKWE